MRSAGIHICSKIICLLMIFNILGCSLILNVVFAGDVIETVCDIDKEDADDVYFESQHKLVQMIDCEYVSKPIINKANTCLQFHPDIAPPPPKG